MMFSRRELLRVLAGVPAASVAASSSAVGREVLPEPVGVVINWQRYPARLIRDGFMRVIKGDRAVPYITCELIDQLPVLPGARIGMRFAVQLDYRGGGGTIYPSLELVELYRQNSVGDVPVVGMTFRLPHQW